MKRLTALFFTVIFCLTLFAPPVMSTPYDPLNPRNDDPVVGDNSTDEADPWGELQLTGGKFESISYDDLTLWWESTKFFVGYYLFGLNFEPQVIIVIKKTTINNEENGTINEDQDAKNTNPKPGAQSPSGE